MLIELTPSGRLTVGTIRQAIDALERRALAGLPAEAISALRAALQPPTDMSA